MVNALLSAVTDTTPGSVYTPGRSARDGDGLVQVSITGSASVNIEGRLNPSAPWVVIATFTSSDARSIALFPHLRANPTANAGTVSVWLAD